MVSFEIFVKSMLPSFSELKVTPSFCFTFKIPDDMAVTTYLTQIKSFYFLIQPLLETRAKKCTKFLWFFGVWENLEFCFRDLLTFS